MTANPVNTSPGTGGPPKEMSELAGRRGGWRRLFEPTVRPVWGFVAVILAFVVLRLAPAHEPRNFPAQRSGASHQIMLKAPQYQADGGVTLAWPSHNEADRYELRFYSPSLAELSRRDAGLDTMVTMAPANLPEAYQRGEAVLYRVVAIHGGDDLETSEPGTLKRP